MSYFKVHFHAHAFSDYTGSTSVSTVVIPAVGPSGSQHWLRPGIPVSHLSSFESMSLAAEASSSLIIEVDHLDETSILFRRPTALGDVLPMYFSGSGRVGIGTKDPKTQFDVKSSDDSSDGTKLLLRSSRGVSPLQVGDSAGEIDFVVESGSFSNIETSGSIGRLRSEVTNVSKFGATGKVVLGVAKDISQGSIDIVNWEYAPSNIPGFVQSMSSSILIKDFSSPIRSRLEFQKSDNGFVYMSLQTGSMTGVGDVTMNGTGSFGLIEGGTF